MQFDTANSLTPKVALNTAAISSSTTTNGVILDTQGYGGLTFVLNVGARTDGTFTLAVTHGDDSGLSDGVTPAADDLVGTAAGTAVSAAQTMKKLGYVGNKRYVRASVVSTSVTSGATVGVTAILGRPEIGPAA
ncbi:hypothetical protein [Mesorhizobium sp. BR-1-1-10]|uniref:hypothetical protein n=1 Tax=Mesorhizobium sp. BR-1-1-10 TaxID=2876660 RepID=UPI001CD1160D|nr:hypothetical protein [Mesorhizobium sp. BR-1-1-10]MBZ9975486.1 hypothetical protein [Mesorhizobium sp. BR-1-1-10]